MPTGGTRGGVIGCTDGGYDLEKYLEGKITKLLKDRVTCYGRIQPKAVWVSTIDEQDMKNKERGDI